MHAMFAGLISRIFSANEQYFSLIINQSIVLSAMAYQPSEQGGNLQRYVSLIAFILNAHVLYFLDR